MGADAGFSDVFGSLTKVTEPSPPPPGTTIRVNAGGAQHTDPSGLVWSADYGYNGGVTYSVTRPIANTTTPVLYQSVRYHTSTLQYQFTVSNGNYDVKLKFAEIFFTSAGQRVFTIVINGQTVQSNFDALSTR